MFAIIQSGSSQHLVKEGDEILVDRLENSSGKLVLDKVLLFSDDKNILIGKPYLPDLKISAQILSEVKGKKIRTSTYKAKSRFRKTKGFRPKYSKIKILTISK
jgi:large subunit ribosomal protein L21